MSYREMSEEELRERVRTLLADAHPDEVDRVTFRGRQYDHGLANVHLPEGYGGLGLSPKMQSVVNDEIRKNAQTFYEDMALNPVGIGMGVPVILTHGADWMKDVLPRRAFTGEDIWCQLFSEPGAGSDLAGLATRAIRRGDEWVVNGQKVWTSLAHYAKWGLLLARTNPDVPKHKGLSYFLLEMDTPGVDIRPLYQMTGDAQFNEVFLGDVRVPHRNMLGQEGEGWKVAITTLMNERTAVGGAVGERDGGAIGTLLDLWRSRGERRDGSRREIRDRVVKLWIEAELLRLTNMRAKIAQKAGQPGPEGSVGKLAWAELNQRIWACGMDVLGSDGLVYEPGYGEGLEGARGSGESMVKYQFLRSRANSIEGGTSEVMRNILGERVLGLPEEPRVDKNIPWRDVPRGR